MMSIRLKDGVPAAHYDWSAKETMRQKQERLQPGKTPVDIISVCLGGLWFERRSGSLLSQTALQHACSEALICHWLHFKQPIQISQITNADVFGNGFSRAKSHRSAQRRFETVVFIWQSCKNVVCSACS